MNYTYITHTDKQGGYVRAELADWINAIFGVLTPVQQRRVLNLIRKQGEERWANDPANPANANRT